MTTLLIIGAVLVWCGLFCAAAGYLVRRIERAGMPVRRLEVEDDDVSGDLTSLMGEPQASSAIREAR